MTDFTEAPDVGWQSMGLSCFYFWRETPCCDIDWLNDTVNLLLETEAEVKVDQTNV